MVNVRNIIKNNRKTFYNFRSKETTDLRSPRLLKIALGLFLTLVFFDVQKDFVNAVLTIYAILVGFSFNILFHLLSIEKTDLVNEKVIERKIIQKRLDTLLEELFYNISYFNLVSIFLIFLSLFFFLFLCDTSLLLNKTGEIKIFLIQPIPFNYVLYGKLIFRSLYYFVLYLALIESIYSFVRTLSRVNYFFEEKLNLGSVDNHLSHR